MCDYEDDYRAWRDTHQESSQIEEDDGPAGDFLNDYYDSFNAE